MEKGNWLLCDLHIHTRMSDGKLSLQEVIDLYGQAGFDCIAITDHILDELHRSYGKNVAPERFPEYLVSLHEAAKMAMNRYGMILLPGAELTN
jgi:hypothetical protein